MKRLEYETFSHQQISDYPRIRTDISTAIILLAGNPLFRDNFESGKILAPKKNAYGVSKFNTDEFKWVFLMHSINNFSSYNLAIDIRRYPFVPDTGKSDPKHESQIYFGANYSIYKKGFPRAKAVFVRQFTDGSMDNITDPQQISSNLRHMLTPLKTK